MTTVKIIKKKLPQMFPMHLWFFLSLKVCEDKDNFFCVQFLKTYEAFNFKSTDTFNSHIHFTYSPPSFPFNFSICSTSKLLNPP